MEVIRTSRGGRKLVLNGQTYIVKKDNPGVQIRWVCTKSKEGCKGAVTTNDPPTGNARNATPHNHNASDVDVEVAKFRTALRENANQNHGATTSGLYLNGIQTLSPEALVAMPGANTIKRDIQRQKAKHRPVEPQTIQGIILAHPWTTIDGPRPAPFLIHDCGVLAGPNRVIVFAADDAITHLANTENLVHGRKLQKLPHHF